MKLAREWNVGFAIAFISRQGAKIKNKSRHSLIWISLQSFEILLIVVLHSVLRLLTGLRTPALTACRPTVNNAMVNPKIPVATKTIQLILIR